MIKKHWEESEERPGKEGRRKRENVRQNADCVNETAVPLMGSSPLEIRKRIMH